MTRHARHGSHRLGSGRAVVALCLMAACGPGASPVDEDGTGSTASDTVESSASGTVTSDDTSGVTCTEGGTATGSTGTTASSADTGASDTATGGTGPSGPPDCPLDWGPTGYVSGTTPLGFFEAEYFWFGQGIGNEVCAMSGDGIYPLMVWMFPDGEAFANWVEDLDPSIPTPRVIPQFGATYSEAQDAFTFEAPFDISHSTESDGITDHVAYTVSITDSSCPKEPLDVPEYPALQGTLSVLDGEWSLEGEFIAPYCAFLDLSPP